ncbi:MAG: NtaA/DmoA family FMN-dependent monooxygenase [Pseudolysinimonas sp.]
MNLIFHTSGRHDAGWKSFEDATTLVDDIDHQIAYAKLAEETKFDAIFLPDTHAVLGSSFLRKPRRGLDPVVLLAAIARETEHLGLISTASSLIGHPYVVARTIATLNHISKGRAGWNIVTSQEDQALEAVGVPLSEKLDRATRYERAAEFVEIVTALWDSLPKEAITSDKDNDVYIDTALTRPVNFEGKHYRSSGVLQLTGRYEGDRPVLFQAGVSPQSREFGAKYADVLFTSQPDVEHDRKFYAEAKAHAAKFGRNPDHLIVLPGLYAVVSESEAAARKRKAEFDELMPLNFLVNNLAKQLGLPVEELDPNKPLPFELFDTIPTDDEVINYRREEIGGVAKANGFTVKELVHHNLNRGQRAIFGTPEQIADKIIEWVDTDVADGFNINIDVQPDGVARFKDVITELQNRGRYRTEYEYRSFRANYGLPSSETG